MQGTRLPALIGILALLILTGVVIVVVDPVGRSAVGGPSLPPAASSDPDIGGPDAAILEVVGEGAGPRFDTTVERGYPTSEVGQSKLWYHAGSWWGALLAEGTNEYRIHRLDWTAQQWRDTGAVIAERAGTLPDVVATGDQVVIVTGGTDPRGRRGAAVLRYTYDPDAQRYGIDSDFPVTLTTNPAASLTVTRGRAGHLWVAYVQAGQLQVTRTAGNDLIWREPAVPEITELEPRVDAVALVPFGDSIALVWSTETHDRVSFAIPTISDDGLDTWEARQIVVEGLQYADDHISVAVMPEEGGERVFMAIKTSLDERANVNRLDPQVLLLVREPDGTWLQYLVGRIADRHSRPVVLLDPENRVVYVIANAPFGGGGIYLKASSIDRISFVAGMGTTLIEKDEAPKVSTATSTKQLIDPAMGLVVLASDSETGEYHHVALLSSGGGEGIARASIEETPPPPRLFVEDRFDPFVTGTPLGNRWSVRASGATTFTIMETDDGRRVTGTVSAADGSRARMCKEIPHTDEGVLLLETHVYLSAVGSSDAIVAALRHEGGISAAVHLSRRGVFSYVDGDATARTEMAYTPGTWYHFLMTVDLSAATYDWEVRRQSNDTRLISVSDVPLASVASGAPADEICLQSPTATGPGLSFLVDSVRVVRP
jgi:hypothetical protein